MPECPSASRLQTVMRPEGRAPMQIVVGSVNTYPMGEG